MLSKPTVLIIGAGASQPYGFPSGRELTEIIMNNLREPQKTPLGKELEAFGCTRRELSHFAQELRLSQHYSVDAFLDDRREFIQVGKLAIAAVLIPREDPTKLFATDNWYKYLLNRLLNRSAPERVSSLTILTYNYDRSLDYYLFTACKRRFDLTNKATIERLKSVEIIHLHGHLGNLLHQRPEEDGYEYQTILKHDHLLQASKSIRIIHEDLNESVEYQTARERLAQAKEICFMGTSFHHKNIERLAPNLWRQNAENIRGTVMGIPLSERADVYSHFGGKMSPYDCD